MDKNIKVAFSYLIISVALAAAGAIYEHFSFGVYSNYMIYAFAIPLIGGTLPFMLRSMKRPSDIEAQDTNADKRATSYNADGQTPSNIADKKTTSNTADIGWTWHAGIATLTIGSIVHGILAISGRPNSLTIIYLVAGILLLICAAISTIKKEDRGNKTNI